MRTYHWLDAHMYPRLPFPAGYPSTYVCTTAGNVHHCSNRCTAPKIQSHCGEYCSFTGCETYGEHLVRYCNPRAPIHTGARAAGRTGSRIGHGAARMRRKRTVRSIPGSKLRVFYEHCCRRGSMKSIYGHNRHAEPTISKTCFPRKFLTFDALGSIQYTTLHKFPGASKMQLPASHAFMAELVDTLAAYSARKCNQSLGIQSTKTFVAAALTLMAEGLESPRRERS